MLPLLISETKDSSPLIEGLATELGLELISKKRCFEKADFNQSSILFGYRKE